MRITSVFAALCLCLLLPACAGLEKLSKGVREEKLYLKPAAFSALPGWRDDAVALAIMPLQKSCNRILKKDDAEAAGNGGFAGTVGEWRGICERLSLSMLATDGEARAFFEANFTPYEIHGDKGREGLFTGYYQPLLNGSLTREGRYTVPLYGRPSDLITVNLGDFKASLKGETVMGRVKGENLVPYFRRSEIEAGALAGQKKEIIWVDDAVDAFFLHIQGSGLVRMKDGRMLQVGYAAQNGQPYYAIGQELVKRGALFKEAVSMQTIRRWLETHPTEAAEVMNLNNSYIFFRPLDGDGPVGAEGVALTPLRSLAVDRKKMPYGAPVFLDADEPEGGRRLQRLMVAQDTGGAITGAVRGDFFWGAGEAAARKAGLMKSKGQAWILLPKSVVVPEQFAKKWWSGLSLFSPAKSAASHNP